MNTEIVMALRLLLAAFLGAVVGFQRGRSHKPAGLRTHTLIATGAALFTIASIYGFTGASPAQVAAGIVAGIGFLGAGAIIRTRDHVHGLTTAASIWAVAAIGLAAGAGLYIIAAVTTAVLLIILLLPHVS